MKNQLYTVRTAHDILFGITYKICGNYVTVEDANNPYFRPRLEIYNPMPIIGQRYMVVSFCDYDNTEFGENYIVEITEENIAEVTFHMNDLENDITQYILIQE